MSKYLSGYKPKSADELLKELKALKSQLEAAENDYSDALEIENAKSANELYERMEDAFSIYITKIEEEYNNPPVYPLDLLPLSKSEIKWWGYYYAYTDSRKKGNLEQSVLDRALCHTRFQPMSPAQWDAIRKRSVDNLGLYFSEMREKGSSALPVPNEFKIILKSFFAEYKSETKELKRYFREKDSDLEEDKSEADALQKASRLIKWKDIFAYKHFGLIYIAFFLIVVIIVWYVSKCK